MKYKKLLAVAGLVAAGAAIAQPPASNLLFRFDGGVGVQVFRNSATGPVLNTVAGVNPGGAPWLIRDFDAVIRKDGSIRAHGEGVLLAGTDNLGTRAGPRQVVLSLFCRNAPVPPAVAGTLQTTPFNSDPVDLDADGDFEVHGKLWDSVSGTTPPETCGDTVDNRPVLLIRAVAAGVGGNPPTPSAWFAAGLLADGHRDHGRHEDRD